MGTIIRNDPKGEIQTAINELVKQSIEMFAPCLIAGHEAEPNIVFEKQIILNGVRGDIVPPAYRHQPDNWMIPKIPISLKLCARCGVVYEEKIG